MKICLYSPYVPKHFGGGEKYLFDVAQVLAKKHQVVVGVNQDGDLGEFKKKYQDFFGRDLAGIEFIHTSLGTQASFSEKLLWTKQFDVMYYATDGSLFFSLAKRNILHIQFPLRVNKRSLIERLKLANWQVKNTNSEFTKKIVEPSWPVKIDVVHQPMIDVAELAKGLPSTLVDGQSLPAGRQDKVILHVGRFFKQLHTKRQDVMVKMFKDLLKQEPKLTKGWKLVFIGGVEDENYFKEVQKLAKGLPIEFYENLTRSELVSWYQKASIYWHATGFGVDQEKHPEKVEHFGISTLEAMAAGSAPVVINKGGQPEVLGPELADQLWDSEQDCIDKTLQLIKDKKLRSSIAKLAQKRAQDFGPERFEKQLWRMIDQ